MNDIYMVYKWYVNEISLSAKRPAASPPSMILEVWILLLGSLEVVCRAFRKLLCMIWARRLLYGGCRTQCDFGLSFCRLGVWLVDFLGRVLEVWRWSLEAWMMMLETWRPVSETSRRVLAAHNVCWQHTLYVVAKHNMCAGSIWYCVCKIRIMCWQLT